ncbi:hypothetical protein BT96DRAFT_1085460 [Gymnopus androsaceus JB14]|uniref:UDP-Glycosyltransferase/glycogen phosphorylase n=1 Tax=Gymnopus androsaceus JB14 TaxID=1447944 RepID=A0A6A4IMS3_9AGAR|nr:hypothetical protein BT96DRAFT_1085460 [Gymnopus androsaceus JB14]
MAPTHFLVISSPFFGHVRPIFTFAMNLLVMYPELHITFVTTGTISPAFTPPFDRELTLYGLEDGPRSRLNVKLLGQGELESVMAQIMSIIDLFPEFLRELLTPDPLSFSPFKFLPALTVVDIMALPAVDILDDIAPQKIPVLCYTPTNAAMLNLYFIHRDEYPETYWRHIYHKAEAQVTCGLHEGMNIDQIAFKIWLKASHVVAQTASLPPMYNHELNPQSDLLDTDEKTVSQVNQARVRVAISITNSISKLDGFIIHTSPLMEPGEVEEMRQTSPEHRFFHIGPQYPELWWNGGIPPQVQVLSPEDDQVMSFLNDMHKRYGANSVLYISFGTYILPPNAPHLFDALIKTILTADPPLPFLFARATGNQMLTPKHREEIEKSGLGLLAGFVPQQAVLKHEAIGWYLCHAGSNSISESFLK